MIASTLPPRSGCTRYSSPRVNATKQQSIIARVDKSMVLKAPHVPDEVRGGVFFLHGPVFKHGCTGNKLGGKCGVWEGVELRHRKMFWLLSLSQNSIHTHSQRKEGI